MKEEEVNLQPQSDEEIDMTNMDQDIVENFARQLDEVVRIQEESEEEENDYFEYQALPQDDDEMEYSQLPSDEEEQDIKDPLNITIDKKDKLTPETTDLIKSIMSNIHLSNEAVPDWARKIPEDAWLPRVKKD